MKRNKFKLLNPSVKSVLDAIDYFKSIHKLESVQIYLSNYAENYEFISSQQHDYRFIQRIGSTKSLIEDLLFYEHHITSNATNVEFSDKIAQSFNQLKLFLKSDHLIVVKCNQSVLNRLLVAFNSFITRVNAYSNTSKTSMIVRHLIWIPETDAKSLDLKTSSLILNVNDICSHLKIFSLSWLLSVDSSLYKIIDSLNSRDDDVELSLGKFSFKLLTSFKSERSVNAKCKSKNDSILETHFIFKQAKHFDEDHLDYEQQSHIKQRYLQINIIN